MIDSTKSWKLLFCLEPEEQCGIQGILCLNNHYSDIAVQKTSWSQKPGLNCDCLPGCDEPEYNIITVDTFQ